MAAKCENCYCCGKLLTSAEDKKRRSRLDNKKLEGVLHAFASLVEEVSGGVACWQAEGWVGAGAELTH